ncbi:MAG: hypothetical protein PVSMB1_08010 [Gemmatimonadaceae bacterium]
MNPRISAKEAEAMPKADSAAQRYVLQLRASHGKYARPADETRRLVDESMGSSSLTELLYKSRQDSSS